MGLCGGVVSLEVLGFPQRGWLRARVLSLDVGEAVHRALNVSRGRVARAEGVFEATFRVHEVVGEIYGEGSLLRGVLVREGGSGSRFFRLRGVFPFGVFERARVRRAERVLRADRVARANFVVDRGDGVPDFALYNQRGELMTLADFRGRDWVLNFVFTRCVSPVMCPASTANMVRLARLLEEEGLEDVALVTLTFDPEYDSPAVLRAYAKTFGVSASFQYFLTGSVGLIEDLMHRFGIITRDSDGTLDHTMKTFLINGRGRVAFVALGSSWSAEEFFSYLKQSRLP